MVLIYNTVPFGVLRVVSTRGCDDDDDDDDDARVAMLKFLIDLFITFFNRAP